MVPKIQKDGTWVYTPIGAELEMVGLEKIRVYIAPYQNTVAQCIATRPITDLCLAAERNPGLCLSRQWWDQPALDILGISAGRVVAEGVRIRARKNWREREIRVGKDYGKGLILLGQPETIGRRSDGWYMM